MVLTVLLFSFYFQIRMIDWDNAPDDCFLFTVDGVHCKCLEPRTEPSTQHYSHKSNGPGIAYEVAVAIHESRIIWMNGPFRASTHDLTIYQSPNGLRDQIPNGRLGVGIADSSYSSDPTISTSNALDPQPLARFKSRAKARGETINYRLKKFDVLSGTFRHRGARRLLCHEIAFTCCLVITQYEIELGQPLFAV